MKKSYSIELELENLLGGKVKLVSTPCINKKVWRSNAAIKQCDHAVQNVQAHARRCMKEFVDSYPSCELVVCTSSVKAKLENTMRVPGLIVITRDLRGGIQIDTIPSQIISETIRATKMIDPVKKVESKIFDLAIDVCDDEPQGTTNMRKRKRAGGESKKPKKLQKSEFVLPDDSLRRPDLIDNQSIGASVTAEAQSLFDALWKSLAVRWEKTDMVLENEVRVSSPYLPENISRGTHADRKRVKKVIKRTRRSL